MEQVEALYNTLDDLVEVMKEKEALSDLEALMNVLHLSFMGPDELRALPEEDQAFVERIKAMNLTQEKPEMVRKVMQFAILKAFKGVEQANYMLTPEIIAFYMSYLIEKLSEGKDNIRLFDSVVGTGNLLTGIMNQITKNVEAYASEIDETMLDLAILSNDLQRHEISFFHQDSVKPLLLDPVDVVVCDLPVGYYPDDEVAKGFKVSVDGEHTYAHHLLIEQGLTHLKPEGYMLAVVPNHLFDSEQSQKLHQLIQQEAHVIGLLELPPELFKKSQHRKSIFVLQKKSETSKAPKEALMAKLPNLKDISRTERMIKKMNQWFK